MSLVEDDGARRLKLPAVEELSYPAEFHFRVIAEALAFDALALAAVLAAYHVSAPLASSQASSSGRYQAYSVSVMLRSREEMLAFDAAVKQVPGVRMLL